MEMIMDRAFAAGFAEPGTTSMTYILNAMSNITSQGVGDPISDPISALDYRRPVDGPGSKG